MKFSLGFSPCPNDTFIFDALVNKKIDTEGIEFDIHLEDVQTLNEWAKYERLDFTKISYGVLPLIQKKYIVLESGGALGKGVGPLLISSKKLSEEEINGAQIGVPGQNTTANFLFSIAYPNARNKTFMAFNQVEEFASKQDNGHAYAGVIIHENRFTYQQKGLVKLIDLGDYWETKTGLPIPLGGIVGKRSIETSLLKKVNGLIRKSLEYAFSHYPEVSDYVKQHAQEMSEAVMRQHIDLYVNDFSLELGETGRNAVQQFLQIFNKEKKSDADLFLPA